MKTLILGALLFVGIQSFSQTAFDWYPNDTVVMNVDADSYTQIYIEQVNQTGDTLNLEIEMIYSDVPTSWDGMICVYGLCLGGIPANGFISPMSPIYDTTNGYVRWTVNPMGGEETGEIHVRVYDKDNPTDGDTCVFLITGQSFAGAQDYSASGDFYIFPNPAVDVINISNNDAIDVARLYSIDGRMIEHHILQNQMETIDVSELPSGMYILHGYAEGELVGIRKISVK